MARPTATPTFATAATYPAGASPWSAQPPRVAPSGAVLAQGLTPQTDLPAEYVNYLFGRLGDFVGWLLTIPTTASDVPQYVYQDAAGNNRMVFDHNGYPTGGRISQFREEWPYIANPLAPPQSQVVWAGTPWTYNVATGGSIVVSPPSASYNARYLTLTPPSSLATGTSLWGPQLFLSNMAGMSAVVEFELGMNAAAAGVASKTDCWFGLQDGTDAPDTDQNVIVLHKLSTAANYESYSLVAGVPHTATTVTPPTAGTFPTDKVRIEIQGSASPYGAYQARFFINGALVNTVVAANLPGSFALRPVFSIEPILGAPVGSPVAYVGPLTITWNRFTAGSTL